MFHSVNMQFSHEQLIFKALLVVQEAVHQCSEGPVKISLGLRFALAYLCATTDMKDVATFRHFAACITDPQEGQTTYIGNYLRCQQARGFLDMFMQGAGISPTIDSQTALRKAFEKLTKQPEAKPPSRSREG